MARPIDRRTGLFLLLITIALTAVSLADTKEKALAAAMATVLSAPRPEYPYEARRGWITGFGVAIMEVDTTNGKVRRAYMAQSTGSRLLDDAATSAFGQWRFQPGTVSKVKVPINFTMGGGVYTEYKVESKNMDEILAHFLGKGTVLKGPIPAYPRFPAWISKQGKGVYELHADAQGKIAEVKILKSSGDGTFDRVAVGTLRKWRLRRGPLVLELPLRFSLTPSKYSVEVGR